MDIYSLEGKKEIINSFSPKTKVVKNSIIAFISGGLISLAAEVLRRFLISVGIDKKEAVTLVGICFIVLASVLTAIGVFDKIARYTGPVSDDCTRKNK